MGFEPLVNQRLLPPTFPRYTRLRTRREALQYLEDLVSRIRQCGKVAHTSTFQQAMVSLLKCSEVCQIHFLIVARRDCLNSALMLQV